MLHTASEKIVNVVEESWFSSWSPAKTLAVMTLSEETWELITSKAKCFKLGLKQEEVVHLFINCSSSDGCLDVSRG